MVVAKGNFTLVADILMLTNKMQVVLLVQLKSVKGQDHGWMPNASGRGLLRVRLLVQVRGQMGGPSMQ